VSGAPRDKGEGNPGIGDILSYAAWNQALFTTYMLSLGYFESEVLRSLLRTGCTDIQVVVDAEGYRASLLERRSARVGLEYRLIPAALPHGVFHAKCIYLAGDDEDLLLIGSGNVTFGGHGRNAEVFEALRSNEVPGAFEEFARFLGSLGARNDILFARKEWIHDFAERAMQAARRSGVTARDTDVRLVHSLDSPVDRQLPDLLAHYGSCTRGTVMSPYHDPDGFSVRRLLAAVNVPRGRVAVTGDTTSPFPFAVAANWERPVEPVRLRAPEKRFVHAKWYEFETAAGRVLLTGSINATRKALTTTDNVELGVLRLPNANEKTPEWEPAAIPAFAAQKQMPSGLGRHEIVYASFHRTEPDRLHGHLITLQPVAAVWGGRLVDADGDALAFTVDVSENGQFALQDQGLEAFSQRSAVQMILTNGDRQARGWVQNDMLLGTGARRRLTAGALSRLIRREASDDDIQALLDYLSIKAEEHLGLFNRPIAEERSAADDGGGGNNKTVSIRIEELAPIDDFHDLGAISGEAGPAHMDQFHAVMERLRRVLLGHGQDRRLSHYGSHDSTQSEDATEAENGRTPDDIAYALGLIEFERQLGQMIELAAGRPEVRNGLLSILLEVSMAMRIHRLDDKEGAHEFLNTWFFKACRLGRMDTQRMTSLQQHVSTTAATLYILARHPDRRSLLASDLHDALETFHHGPVDREWAHRTLISDPQAGFAAALIGEIGESELADALNEILATRTRRQQLEDALSKVECGGPVPVELDVFQTPLGKRLLKALQRVHPERSVKRAPPDFCACAFDYYAFAFQEAAQFRRERIGYCIQCQRFTVNTTP
jgi:hypothetical protein